MPATPSSRNAADRPKLRALVGLASLALGLLASPARAEEPSSTDQLAEDLFQQGRRAIEAGDVAKGCRLLEQSLAQDDALGTLLNLALCHEKQGRLATASTEFRRVEERALVASPPEPGRASFARQHVEALRPKVSFLAFAWPTSEPEPRGLEVRVDGQLVPRGLWFDGAPLEPGDHAVTVRAEGRAATTTSIVVTTTPTRTTLLLSRPTAPSADATHPALDRRGAIGWAAGGVGAALVVTSAVVGIMAASSAGEASCPAPCFATVAGEGGARVPNPDLVAARGAYDRASTLAAISTGTFLLGLVGLGAGTWLVLGPGSSRGGLGLALGPTGAFGRF